MRFLKAILPNLTIVLAVSLIVILIVDRRNPFMGFLSSLQGSILVIATCACSIFTALVLYISWRREN